MGTTAINWRDRSNGLAALRQRDVEIRGAMRLLIDAAQKENRELTDEEASIYTARKSELEKNSARLAVAVDQLEKDRNAPSVPVDAEFNPRGRAANALRNAPNLDALQRTPGKAGRTFGDLFGASQSSDPSDGWSSMAEFLDVVRTGRHDPRLRMSAAMNESVPSQGGFLTPETLTAEVLDAALESEIVRPRAHVTPMVTETKKIAGFDASDSSGGALYGGISANWAQEAVAQNTQQPKVRLIQLTASKLFLFLQFSTELLADGTGFEALVTEALVKATSWHLDNSFLGSFGDGAGKPKSVLNDPALITIAKETSQPTGTIVYANIAKMFGSLHPSLVNGACWICNPSCLPALLQMTLNVKNVAGTENVGGSALPIFSTDAGEFKMLTLPVLLSEKLPAVGAGNDLILANFSQYEIGIRKELSIESSSHAGFSSDTIYMRGTVRVDGQGRWKGPYKPRNGTATSWCVALAARP